jgi:N-acetylneuraminic acid mutarotase
MIPHQWIIKANTNSAWIDMSSNPVPPARKGSKLVYDNESDQVILFGGHHDPTTLGFYDTWSYDYNTNTWTNKTPDSSPCPRSLHTMAYDMESDRVIIFGGVKISHPLPTPFEGLNDTWTYDFNTNTWTQMNPSLQPTARAGAAMAYDMESDRMILFGGFSETRTHLNDTWAYDFNNDTWTQLTPTISPSVRYHPGLAYDKESDRIIFFGGNHYTSTSWIDKKDTWAYDYNSDSWTNMNPSSSPPARGWPNLAYNALADRIILFGGGDKHKTISYSDTWVYNYNTNTWTEMTSDPHPSGRFYTDLTYDIESNQVILFGGTNKDDMIFNDTWVYDYYKDFPSSTTTPWNVLFFSLSFIVMILLRRRENKS